MTDDSTLMTSYVRENVSIEWFNLMKDQKKMENSLPLAGMKPFVTPQNAYLKSKIPMAPAPL